MSAHGMLAVMYIYNENEKEAEVEVDRSGMFATPMGGTIFNRKGKRWEVLRTTMQSPNVQPEVMPVLKIYLTDQF